jgi:hypothetical protein
MSAVNLLHAQLFSYAFERLNRRDDVVPVGAVIKLDMERIAQDIKHELEEDPLLIEWIYADKPDLANREAIEVILARLAVYDNEELTKCTGWLRPIGRKGKAGQQRFGISITTKYIPAPMSWRYSYAFDDQGELRVETCR